MTHVTFGAFRAGVRNPATTLTTLAAGPSFPTPFPSASAAVVRFHRESPDAAWRRLDRALAESSYWGQAGTPQGGWANSVRECFQMYRDLAAGDARAAFATGLNRDLSLPPDDLGVYIDVVLLDEDGYTGRLVLWDRNDLTPERAALYAAPAWRVLEDELGEGRVTGVEVWHLRSGRREFVDPDEAEEALEDAERIVRRVAV